MAQQLDQLLGRDPAFDVAALSRNPEGGHEDGLTPDRERVASFKVGNQPFELQMERVKLRSGLAVWLFSEDSVKLIPKLSQATSDHPVEKYLQEPLVSSTVLDTRCGAGSPWPCWLPYPVWPEYFHESAWCSPSVRRNALVRKRSTERWNFFGRRC